jgi:ubiquitin-conjugating enzyme E2 variant
MNDFLTPLLQAIGVILAADFASGIIHWIEDAYVREHTPVIGRWIGRANTLHHHLPRHMTRNSWWQSNWDLFLAMGLLLSGVAALGWLSWHWWLFAIVAGNANEVHKWSHRTRRENGPVISLLQDLRVLQTPRHHAIHHTNPKEVHYCPITNVLNPVLDGLRVWSSLEWILAKAIGLRRQPDTSVPSQGTAPAWIVELRRTPRG